MRQKSGWGDMGPFFKIFQLDYMQVFSEDHAHGLKLFGVD